MLILLLADIHGNYPALEAVANHFANTTFDHIVNCGDSVVYAPFPNETIDWLIAHQAISILGNTDKKVLKLIRGKSFKKPSDPNKRIMYTSTADALSASSKEYLLSLGKSATLPLFPSVSSTYSQGEQLGIFHGSPKKPHAFLFDSTPESEFYELAAEYPYAAIVTGHSHTPYHHVVDNTHFINPGSVGRMFDGNPTAACAVLEITGRTIRVHHHRIDYDINTLIQALADEGFPQIYQTMYQRGRKLN